MEEALPIDLGLHLNRKVHDDSSQRLSSMLNMWEGQRSLWYQPVDVHVKSETKCWYGHAGVFFRVIWFYIDSLALFTA